MANSEIVLHPGMPTLTSDFPVVYGRPSPTGAIETFRDPTKVEVLTSQAFAHLEDRITVETGRDQAGVPTYVEKLAVNGLLIARHTRERPLAIDTGQGELINGGGRPNAGMRFLDAIVFEPQVSDVSNRPAPYGLMISSAGGDLFAASPGQSWAATAGNSLPTHLIDSQYALRSKSPEVKWTSDRLKENRDSRSLSSTAKAWLIHGYWNNPV